MKGCIALSGFSYTPFLTKFRHFPPPSTFFVFSQMAGSSPSLPSHSTLLRNQIYCKNTINHVSKITTILHLSPTPEPSQTFNMFRNKYHQNGLLSILYSIGSKPLQLWQSQSTFSLPHHIAPRFHPTTPNQHIPSPPPSLPTVEDGQVQRITDPDLESSAIELIGQNISTSYITCPFRPDQTLAVNLPVIVLIIKSLNSSPSSFPSGTHTSDHKDSPDNHHHHQQQINQQNHFSFEVEILDTKGYHRKLRFSTFHTTTKKVSPTTCSMSLKLDPGWSSLAINLDDFVSQAYNTKYVETARVTIHANCRLRRVYFADKVQTEEELPVEYRCRSKSSNGVVGAAM